MSKVSSQRPTKNANSDHVQRRVRLMAVLGILLTSVVIGGITTTLLYRSQASILANQLFFAIELHSAALQAELARLRNISAQITSRTRIRQELERYLRGEIDRQALASFSVPKLADAMHSNHDVLGITRLDPDLLLVFEVGMDIAPELWPSELSLNDIRIGTPSNGRIVLSAPIRNRAMQTVGVDIIMFRDDRLQQIMQTFFQRVDTRGSIQIATLDHTEVNVFYGNGDIIRPLSEASLREELGAQQWTSEYQSLDDLPQTRSNGMKSVYYRVGNSDWTFVFTADPAEFFGSARQNAALVVLTIMVLALVGIFITNHAVRPLVTKLSNETRNLQDLLRSNEELLDKIKANETQLQAVIDNAPAVIYIKDRDGRYLLVNSSFEQLLDLPHERIIDHFDYELFPDNVARANRDADIQILNTRRAHSTDEKVPRKDGIHEYLATRFPLVDSKGEIYAICGIATDITERKLVERRLTLTQTTVDRANIGIYWTDARGQLLYLNDTARESLQLRQSDLPHIHLSDVVPSLEREDWDKQWKEIKQHGGLQFQSCYQRQDGSHFPVEVHANHVVYNEQEFYIAMVHDISERMASEQHLRQSAAVFDYTAEAIVITDTSGTILNVNGAFTRMLGYTKDEVVGGNPRIWKSGVHETSFYMDLWHTIQNTGTWRGELVNRGKSGKLIAALTTVSAVNDDHGDVSNYVAIYTDISEIKESQQRLAHMAHHDPLTDLPNRLLFNERLQHSLDRTARSSARLAVIFLDLDHFKHVNDSLGHSHGDELLIEVAELLNSVLRKDDTIARIGGDEFAILIEDIGNRGELVAIIEKIIAAFERDFVLGQSNIRVTPSLGVSISPDDGEDPETLLRNADAAMYRAKSLGRNTYQFYTEELTRLAFERMNMDAALRKAIDKGEFQLCYQPQFALDDERIIGMEVLTRWESPELGMVPPDQFIPLAEDNGVILPLGEWILLEACTQAKRWHDAGILPGLLAVNISGVQIRRGKLANVIKRILQKTGLPADRLELEVTESFIMGESEQAIQVLYELRKLGIALTVDDFGTGYSSLSYLKSLPIHRLKIDKSFIRDIPEDPNDMAITRAVIALGNSLGLQLVAEGVETEVQRDFLLTEGCDFAQGYLFHRPMNVEDVEGVLRESMPKRKIN